MSSTSIKQSTTEIILEDLIELGFLKYEAQVYLALVVSGPMNPTEIAKRSEVPRPNVYDTLKKLLEKGFVNKEDVKRAPRYMAVSPSEVISKLKSNKLRELEKLEQLENTFQNDLEKVYLEIMSRMSPTETGWLIIGKNKIYNQVKRILQESTEEIYSLITPDVSTTLNAKNDLFNVLVDKSNEGITVTAGWKIDKNNFKMAESLNSSKNVFHWSIGEMPLGTYISDSRECLITFIGEWTPTPTHDLAIWLRNPKYVKAIEALTLKLFTLIMPASERIKELKSKS